MVPLLLVLYQERLMSSIFSNFLTNKSLFFDLFDQSAQNLVNMALLLEGTVNTTSTTGREDNFNQLNKLALNGDDITHKINLWLNKIMFTPLNRNDIYALTAAIDDVADMIREAGSRMYLYDAGDFMPAINEIANILLKVSLKIQQAVVLLRSQKKSGLITDLCQQVKDDERKSDQVYYQAAATLFSDEKDPIRLIKYREILSSLENAVNKCKGVTDVLNTMMIH